MLGRAVLALFLPVKGMSPPPFQVSKLESLLNKMGEIDGQLERAPYVNKDFDCSSDVDDVLRGYADENHGYNKAKALMALRGKQDAFIETGTHHGGTLGAVEGAFKQSFSVELSDELYNENVQRFKNKPNVHLYKGASEEKMASMHWPWLQPRDG